MRVVSDAIPVPVAYLDGDGNLLHLNHEFKKRFDLRARKGNPLPLPEIFHEDGAARAERHLRKALGGVRVTFEEHRREARESAGSRWCPTGRAMRLPGASS